MGYGRFALREFFRAPFPPKASTDLSKLASACRFVGWEGRDPGMLMKSIVADVLIFSKKLPALIARLKAPSSRIKSLSDNGQSCYRVIR
jgi:hypothetical protein